MSLSRQGRVTVAEGFDRATWCHSAPASGTVSTAIFHFLPFRSLGILFSIPFSVADRRFLFSTVNEKRSDMRVLFFFLRYTTSFLFRLQSGSHPHGYLGRVALISACLGGSSQASSLLGSLGGLSTAVLS